MVHPPPQTPNFASDTRPPCPPVGEPAARGMSGKGKGKGGKGGKGGRGGKGAGGGRGAGLRKKEVILDLDKLIDQYVRVKFQGGREGA